MAFIPKDRLPKNAMIGRRFKTLWDIDTIEGRFEKGTILTCIEMHPYSVTFSDGEGHNVLLNNVTASMKLEQVL